MNFDQIGEMVLGSRLRALSEKVTADAEKLYESYGVELKPKWFPVFYFLSNQQEGKPITTIAQEIGHTHPSVIKIIKEMSQKGLISEQKDANDGRKNNIQLTEKGFDLEAKISCQCNDVGLAIKNTLNQTQHNLWVALQEFEYLLDEKSLFERVMKEKKNRESSAVEIVDIQPKHYAAFRELNEEWISQYFQLEDVDRKVLEDPQNQILDKGGKILIAIEKEVVLGTCALLKMQDKKYDYEVAKMAVSPKAQGKGIGSLLGKSIIEKAQELNANYLYLESNTKLKPAISLYEKLGFKKVAGHKTPYDRCNIQMDLKID